MLENPEVTVLFKDAGEEGVVDVLEIEWSQLRSISTTTRLRACAASSSRAV